MAMAPFVSAVSDRRDGRRQETDGHERDGAGIGERQPPVREPGHGEQASSRQADARRGPHEPEPEAAGVEGDLGEHDLYSYRDESWLVRRAFYESALDQIAALHALPESVGIEMKQHLPAEFNS